MRWIPLLFLLLLACDDDSSEATPTQDASISPTQDAAPTTDTGRIALPIDATVTPTPDAAPTEDAALAVDAAAPAEDAALTEDAAPPEVDAAIPTDGGAPALDASAPACEPVVTINDRGWPVDGWGWEKLGPILPGFADSALAPSVIPWGEGLRIYFTRQTTPTQSLWTATSEDGLTWTEPEAVEGVEGSYPSAIALPGGGVRLYFGSGFIERADSDDGVRFSEAETVLATSALEGAISFIYPHAIERAGELWLYFTYFDGQTYRLGHARGPVDGDLEVTAPVLEAGPDYDNASVAQARVHPHGDGYTMWYGAYDTSLTDPGPWRVAQATSADGLTWTRVGLSVDLHETDGDDAWSTRDPALIYWRGELWMFYAGLAPDMKLRLLLARAACPDQPHLLE